MRILTLAGGMLIASLALATAPASASSIGLGAIADSSPMVDTVQFDRPGRGYYGERRSVRPGRVIGRVLGVGPGYRDRGYRGRGYGYGRGYGRGPSYGRGYNRY